MSFGTGQMQELWMLASITMSSAEASKRSVQPSCTLLWSRQFFYKYHPNSETFKFHKHRLCFPQKVNTSNAAVCKSVTFLQKLSAGFEEAHLLFHLCVHTFIRVMFPVCSVYLFICFPDLCRNPAELTF